jgi:hypothetical protein
LILKDYFSGFVELIPTTSPDHCTVSDASWTDTNGFGVPQTLVSDRSSHFVDKTLKEFNRILQARQHFVMVYTPWGNETVEIV